MARLARRAACSGQRTVTRSGGSSIARASIILLAILCAGPTTSADDPFPGWPVMRLIEQEGYPSVLRSGDLDQDGCDELIVVNTRFSRLDVYRWVRPDQRDAPLPPDEDRPNELPMAPEFRRQEVQLDQLPYDLLVADLDGDDRAELIMLAGPPNRILVYEQVLDEPWRQRDSFDLLPGQPGPMDHPLLLRPGTHAERQLLISFASGIQTLSLWTGSRAAWLTPREHRGRLNWWLADLDGDGDQDLVEQVREASESVRWYPCAADGQMLPAQTIFDRAISGAGVLARAGQRAHLLLLDGASQGLLRRYELARGPQNLLGQQRMVGLGQQSKVVWCGLKLPEQAALVVADRNRPRLLVYRLEDQGFGAEASFPAIGNIKAVAATGARPGTLLIWAKDAADLQISRWENGRLTYPKPWPQTAQEQDRKILALASAGLTLWWVQKAQDQLHLYQWPAGRNEPLLTRFGNAVGKKAAQVMWLGPDDSGRQRLLVRATYAKNAQLAVADGDQTTISEPAHLAKSTFSQFRLIRLEDRVRAVRLVDGVLQWLDDQLHAVDQIMLPHGQQLTGYVALDASHGWALQENGKWAHLMQLNAANIAEVARSQRLPGGQTLVDDPVLGLMLVNHGRLTQLSEGQGHQLKLVQTIDSRVGRPSGVKEATMHRIATADITGDGHDEVVLFDDRRHQMTVLMGQAMAGELSWPVFEDKRYPYSGDDAPLVAEPRAIVALDVDADRRQDLAMACHDRLIFYLGGGRP